LRQALAPATHGKSGGTNNYSFARFRAAAQRFLCASAILARASGLSRFFPRFSGPADADLAPALPAFP